MNPRPSINLYVADYADPEDGVDRKMVRMQENGPNVANGADLENDADLQEWKNLGQLAIL